MSSFFQIQKSWFQSFIFKCFVCFSLVNESITDYLGDKQKSIDESCFSVLMVRPFLRWLDREIINFFHRGLTQVHLFKFQKVLTLLSWRKSLVCLMKREYGGLIIRHLILLYFFALITQALFTGLLTNFNYILVV